MGRRGGGVGGGGLGSGDSGGVRMMRATLVRDGNGGKSKGRKVGGGRWGPGAFCGPRWDPGTMSLAFLN